MLRTLSRDLVYFLAPRMIQGEPRINRWSISIPDGVTPILLADLSQDLLVTRRSSTGLSHWEFTCAILTLSSGLPHPKAKDCLRLMAPADWVATSLHYTRVQVALETLAIGFANQEQSIHVFVNWQSGEVLDVYRSQGVSKVTRLAGLNSSLVLIGNRSFLVGAFDQKRGVPSIHLYAIAQANPLGQHFDGVMPTQRSICLATYELPQLRGVDCVRISLTMLELSKHPFSNPSFGQWNEGPLQKEEGMGPTRLESHFRPNISAAMLHIQIGLQPLTSQDGTTPDTHEDDFFTPLWPFLRQAKLSLSVITPSRNSKIVLWEEWGPQRTRWVEKNTALEFPQEPSEDWQSFVRMQGNREGSKLVFPRHVIDFAPFETSFLQRDTKAQNNLHNTEGCTSRASLMGRLRTRLVIEPTILKSPWYDPITSYLPYFETRLPELIDADDILLVGDMIVGIEVSDGSMMHSPSPNLL
jgi:hypothetical protein